MRRFLVLVMAALLLALSACGGGQKASTTFNVTLSDFKFTPDTFVVPAFPSWLLKGFGLRVAKQKSLPGCWRKEKMK